MTRSSKPTPTWYRVGLLGVLGGAVLFSGVVVARSFFSDARDRGGLIADVLSLVHEQHVDQPSIDDLTEAALGAIANSVGDPFTIYVPPADVAEFEKQLTGAYSGIGASIEVRDGVLTIVSPLEDSPAYRAGLLPDDRVVAIEGEPTVGLSATEAVTRLVGESGTKVTITIERNEERFDVTLVREDIVSRTIRGFARSPDDPEQWQHAINDQIAYIRITQFSLATAEELDAALDAAVVQAPNLRGLILDLRGNPGGLMDAAIKIADRFLADGIIVAAAGPKAGTSEARATSSDSDSGLEVVVLVDGASASASEILAGALAGNDRAIVVGTRSFGKGSVQQVWPLLGGLAGEIKITQAYYKVPTLGGGLARVHRKPEDLTWGIDPSPGHYVAMSTEQLINAREVRFALDKLGGSPTDQSVGVTVDSLEDPQLSAAFDTLQARLASGEWGRPGGDLPTPDEVASTELARAMETREFLNQRLAEITELIDSLEQELEGVETNQKSDPL